jgi:large repetitive protein
VSGDDRGSSARSGRVRRSTAAAIAVVMGALLVAGAAGAQPGTYSAAVSPTAVRPSISAGYAITLHSQGNSAEKATSGDIKIPSGFSVNAPSLSASASGGGCGMHPWVVSIDLVDPAKIDLASVPPDDGLCGGATLMVTFEATSAGAEGNYEWTTELFHDGTLFDLNGAQPQTVVDATSPPAPSIDSAPPTLTNQTSAAFGFSDSEAGVAFQCQLDGGGFTACTSPQPYSVGHGGHTFAVKAIDAAGNESGVTSFSWTVDTVAPPAPTIDGTPSNPTTDRSATFGFSDAEPGVGFQCQLDGGGFAGCPPASYSGLADGAHTFEVRAVDSAGNASEVTSYTWTIDTTPPPPPLITSAPQNPSGSANASFSFTDAESVSFQCQLDGLGFSPCTSPQPYSNLDEGSHNFDVKAVDALGHESLSTPYTWTIDTVHPIVTLTDKPPLITNRTSASFSFSSNKSGSTYECKLDAGGFSNCTSPRLYTGLDDGEHTFSVRATSLGNTGLTTEYTWTVDTVAPGTTITATPPASSSSATASFSFSSSEVGSTFACSLDASGFTSCASPQTYTGLGDGTHTFRVEAVDAAGNADTTPATYSWQIRGVGPATTDRTPPGNVKRLTRNVRYGMLKLAWTRPGDADFDHVKVFVSTSPKSPPRSMVYRGKGRTYTNKRFKNGLYYRYAVLSYDHIGNASRGAAVAVPPSALLRSPRDGAVVKSPPRLRWAAVRGATFYNVQLYSPRAKMLSAWPGRAALGLRRSWTYSGRRFALKKGFYRWFVWPGFGPRAKARYGQLLGQGTFRVS